jgi:sugar-specific transcriptional regulator TrmB
MSAKNLKEIFGLSDYENRLYFAAMGSEYSISELSKRAGMPRTAVYPPLRSLVNKGFFCVVKIGNRSKYRSIELKQLTHLLDRRRVDLQEVVDSLAQNIIDNNHGIRIRYFQGRRGMDEASDIFLNETTGKLWKIFENPAKVEEFSGRYQYENFNKRRIEKKVKVRVITSGPLNSTWLQQKIKQNTQELREVVMVSSQMYPIESTIVVSGDAILIS